MKTEKAQTYFSLKGSLSKETVRGETRIPIRPLGELSDTAVEDLPQTLALGNGSLLNQVIELEAGRLLQGTLPQPDTAEYHVGRLDVMLLYAGMSHTGQRIGDQTSALVRYFSTSQPQTLTYEDIVLSNPLRTLGNRPIHDPRTFTTGEIGADEEQFYLIHQDLELAIRPPIEALAERLTSIRRSGRVKSSDITLFNEQQKPLDVLIQNTRVAGQKMQHFDGFRKFLGPITLTGTGLEEVTKGPSGTYSGTVHALDLLVIGADDDRDNGIETFIAANKILLPTSDYQLIEAALALSADGYSLYDLAKRFPNTPGLIETTEAYLHKLLLFRHVHKGSVRKQIPQALDNPEEIGTGGISDVAVFLEQRLNRVKSTLNTLQKLKNHE